MTFKICAVGCGQHASAMHGPSLVRYAMNREGVELTACCDIDESKAAAYRERFGFRRHFADLDDMLRRETPDAVSLAVPPHLTAKLAERILEAGIPLLLEKPPGRTKAETIRLMEAAAKGNAAHSVAFNRRFDPIVRRLKSRLDELRGHRDIHHIRYDMYRVNRFDADFSTTAIHAIDAVRYIAGADCESVRFRYQQHPGIGDGVVNTFMEMTFETGAIAHLHICPISGVRIERVTVNAYDHTFFAEIPMWYEYDRPGRLVHLRNNEVVSDDSGPAIAGSDELYVTGGFYAENEAFFDAIRRGVKPEADLASCLQSVEIAECMSKGLPEYAAAKR